MAELNVLKQLEGQSWSKWKKLCENLRTGEGVKKNEYSYFKKLNRSDMPLYGLCPKTEIFELVVCNYCGLKYKLPAIAEHITLRHTGDKRNGISSITKPKDLKKGKLKRAKEKLKNRPQSVTVKVDMKIDFLEIVSDRKISKSLQIDFETVSKIKQIHVNTNTDKKNSESDVSCEEESVLNNGSCGFKESDLNNDLSSKHLGDSSAVKTNDASSSPVPQVGEIIDVQPLVKLSSLPQNSHTQSIENKDIELMETKPELENSIKSTAYNPEIHCGVVDKESEPCLRSLDCKIHSASLKILVTGRSVLHEVLSSDPSSDKKMYEVSQAQSTEGSSVVSILPNGPANLDNNSVSLMNCENSDQLPFPVSGEGPCEEKNKQNDSVNEGNVFSTKLLKRSPNDLQGLSLPVSIKNPSILCQLQNIKSRFYTPVKAARCNSIHDVLKSSLAHKHSKTQCNSPASKENADSVLIEVEGDEKIPSSTSSDLKLEWFQQWHPGYRRAGGLLYSSLQTSSAARRATPHKIYLTQSANHRTFICKRTSNNINGILPAKVKRQEAVVQFFAK